MNFSRIIEAQFVAGQKLCKSSKFTFQRRRRLVCGEENHILLDAIQMLNDKFKRPFSLANKLGNWLRVIITSDYLRVQWSTEENAK